jgi:hypothetical protein
LFAPAKTANKEDDCADNIKIGYGVEIENIITSRMAKALGK